MLVSRNINCVLTLLFLEVGWCQNLQPCCLWVLACCLQLTLVEAVGHPGAQGLTYLHSKGTDARVKSVSHWVVADLANPRWVQLVAGALSN